MTTQTIIIVTQDYGPSLSTPTLRNYLTDAEIATADSASETSADSGRYALVFTESAVHPAGWYGVRAFVSGAPINRFVYLTGIDGETAISVMELPIGVPQIGQVVVERSIADIKPITFSFPVPAATITGTRRIDALAQSTVAGAITFLRTEGSQHLYSLAFNVADRPSGEGVARYVFTDGVYSRNVVLRTVVSVGTGGSSTGTTLILGATIPLNVGTVTGLDQELVIGDTYTAAVGRRIPVTLTDIYGNAISTTFGSKSLSDGNCTIRCLFHPENSRNTGNVKAFAEGECQFVAAVGQSPAMIWLSLSQNLTFTPGVYRVQFRAEWSTGESVTLAWKGSATFVRRLI